MFDIVATQALVGCSPALQSGIVTGIVTLPVEQLVPLQTFTLTGQVAGPVAGPVQLVEEELTLTTFPQVLEVHV